CCCCCCWGIVDVDGGATAGSSGASVPYAPSRSLRARSVLELHRLLDRQVGGPGAFQDAIDIGRSALELFYIVDAIGEKPAGLDEVRQRIDCGDAMARRLGHDALAMRAVNTLGMTLAPPPGDCA